MKTINLIVGFILTLSVISYGQSPFRKLTDYKSDRKSYHVLSVSDSKRFMLVSDNEDNLSVCSIDGNGQLNEVFKSSIVGCQEIRISSTSIDDTHILFYFPDQVLLENFHTGEKRINSNIPNLSEQYATVNFVGRNYYGLNGNKFYLFDKRTDQLIETYSNYPFIIGDILLYRGEITNYSYQATHLTSNKKFAFDENVRWVNFLNDTTSLLFQSQDFSNLDYSLENIIFSINQNGTIDTFINNFPKFIYVEKSKNSNKFIGVSESYNFSGTSSYISSVYEYSFETNQLALVDTLHKDLEYRKYFINDSLFLFQSEGTHYIRDIKHKVETSLTVPSYFWFLEQVKDYLVFLGNDDEYFVYNFKNSELTKLGNNYELRYFYSIVLHSEDKLLFVDPEHLERPVWEVSDSIYLHHQEIVKQANSNGFRTSFINQSKNYIYTFDENAIVVFDSLQSKGFSSVELVDSMEIFDFLSQNIYEFEDVLYVVLPMNKNSVTQYDIISIELKTLLVTNLTETYDLKRPWGNSKYNITGHNGILMWQGMLFDTKSKNILDISNLAPNNFYTFQIINNSTKIILLSSNEFYQFTYPDLNLISNVKYNQFGKIGNEFYAYTKDNNNNVYVTDGNDEVVVQNVSGFSIANGNYTYSNEVLVLRNFTTKAIKAFRITYDAMGKLKSTQLYDNPNNKMEHVSIIPHYKYFILGSQDNSVDLTVLTDIENIDFKEFPGMDAGAIIDIYDNKIIYSDRKLKKIVKLNMNGDVVSTVDFPPYINTLVRWRSVNMDKDNGLYILGIYGHNNDSKIIFDAENMTFINGLECTKQSYIGSYFSNVGYKDGDYYFNLSIDSSGYQFYKMHNPYSGRIIDTKEVTNKSISISPNPTHQIIELNNLECSSINSIFIYNYFGQKIQLVIRDTKDQIDISNLPSGTYIVEIQCSAEKHYGRFVKI